MDHINCPKCGKELPADARFCFACGTEIPAVTACPKCRRELPPEARFCTYCGAAIKAEAEAAQPAPPEGPRTVEKPSVCGSAAPVASKPEPPKLSRKALIAFGGAAALLLVLVLVLFSGPSRSSVSRPPSGTGSPSGSTPTADPVNTPAGTSCVLMADTRDDTMDSGTSTSELLSSPKSAVFGSDITRQEISSVTFTDHWNGSADSWDVSEARDGSVTAWTERNGNGYDLFIGAEGGVTAPADCSYMFAGYSNVESIRFNGAFRTETATSMRGMFMYCSALSELETAGLDTSNVTDLSRMFVQCGKLSEVDLSRWDVSQVTDMEEMFFGCSGMTALYTGGWDTSRVTDMSLMFSSCTGLTALNLDHWNTSGVTAMELMFAFCESLERLNAGSWDTSGVTRMKSIFAYCGSLAVLDAGGWDTSHADTENMFLECALAGSNAANVLLNGSTPPPSAEPPVSSPGNATAVSGPTLPDPSEFLHGKLKHRERDISGGVEIHFYFDKTSKSAAYEYADLLSGKGVDLTLRERFVDRSSDNGSTSVYYVYDYAGSGSVDPISQTTTHKKQNFEAPVIVNVVEFGGTSYVSSNWLYLTIYCSNDFSFTDSGDRSTDSTFEDFYNTYDPDTAFLGPVGTGFKYGGSSGGSSSGPDTGPSSSEREKINCPSCGGSGKKQCYTCNGTGIERHYKSGGSANGAAAGEWVSERCGTCDGKGTIKCIPCQGTGKV